MALQVVVTVGVSSIVADDLGNVYRETHNITVATAKDGRWGPSIRSNCITVVEIPIPTWFGLTTNWRPIRTQNTNASVKPMTSAIAIATFSLTPCRKRIPSMIPE